VLPALIAHLPDDRRRLGLRFCRMAWLLGLSVREYQALEAGELEPDAELDERIAELCGWPTGLCATSASPTSDL
jgi:hypothetical protein